MATRIEEAKRRLARARERMARAHAAWRADDGSNAAREMAVNREWGQALREVEAAGAAPAEALAADADEASAEARTRDEP